MQSLIHEKMSREYAFVKKGIKISTLNSNLFSKPHCGCMLICLFVGWLLNIPVACECISGRDLLRQFDVLPH